MTLHAAAKVALSAVCASAVFLSSHAGLAYAGSGRRAQPASPATAVKTPDDGAALCGQPRHENYPGRLQLQPHAKHTLAASTFVGMSVEGAEKRASAMGAVVRVISDNGRCRSFDLASLSNRVTVAVKNDYVIDASIS